STPKAPNRAGSSPCTRERDQHGPYLAFAAARPLQSFRVDLACGYASASKEPPHLDPAETLACVQRVMTGEELRALPLPLILTAFDFVSIHQSAIFPEIRENPDTAYLSAERTVGAPPIDGRTRRHSGLQSHYTAVYSFGRLGELPRN